MANQTEGWTPYGLEAIRQSHLRRKRIIAALAGLLLLILALTLVQTTTSSRTSILANGEETSTGINIPDPVREEKQNYVTVSLQPGRVSRLETGEESGGSDIQRNSLPQTQGASPYPWKLWLTKLLPYLLAAAAVYWLAKRRGKHDEVNFGVYKGAMPFEMITADQERAVFTRRHVKSSVFGKGRADHVPPEVTAAAREDG